MNAPTQHAVEITEQQQLARDTYRLRFECPTIAERIVPGQFLMLRLAQLNDPLLGRPLALYDVARDGAGRPKAIDVVYYAGGKLTRRLAAASRGTQLDVWGPLGNGFPRIDPSARLWMVAGGIGQTPFLALAKETLGLQQYGRPLASIRPAGSPTPTLLYGARSADLLAGVADFTATGTHVLTITDDGTSGRRGLVTELLRTELQTHSAATATGQVVCCGPEPMMAAAAELAQSASVSCWVSLETPMACGIGICFTCVARVRQPDGQWDFRRTCIEGPVFSAELIAWDKA